MKLKDMLEDPFQLDLNSAVKADEERENLIKTLEQKILEPVVTKPEPDIFKSAQDTLNLLNKKLESAKAKAVLYGIGKKQKPVSSFNETMGYNKHNSD